MKQFTEELRAKLAEHLASKEVTQAISAIKEATDSGTFEMIVSSEHRDRSGEVVIQDGIDTSYYMKNPVVLPFHDYWSLPVGITESLEIREINGVKCTIAKGRFAPTEDGQEFRALYDAKMLNAASIGFIPKVWGEDDMILESQLLEWSFVPVPCNPEAVRLLGLDVERLAKKGFIKAEIKESEPVETPAEETPADVEEVKPQQEEKKPEEEEVTEEVQATEETPAEPAPAEEKSIKAGRVLSSANRAKIESAIAALSEVLSLDDEASKGVEGEGEPEPKVEEEPKPEAKRSISEVEILKQFDEHSNVRALLRGINNATSKALEKYNRRSK